MKATKITPKHTQGKWKLKRTKSKDFLTPIRVVVGHFDTTVATVEIDVIEDEIEANAKLIASAPDLLEALMAIVTPDGMITTTTNKLRALEAIKKATT